MGSRNKASEDFAWYFYEKNDYVKLLLPDKIIAKTKVNGKIVWDAMPSLCVFFSVKGLRYVKKDVIAAVNIKEG